MGSANEKMWRAIEKGDEDLFIEAVENGADVNARRDRYSSSLFDAGPRTLWTPLHCAVYEQRVAIVELLLEAGADVNQLVDEVIDTSSKKRQGLSPLHYAAMKGNRTLVELLLEYGADVNASKVGWTPLGFAFQKERREVVDVLLKYGAYLVHGSETALHYACGNGNVEVVRMLLKKGMDVNARASRIKKEGFKERNVTPLHYACEAGHYKIAQILLKRKDILINAKALRQPFGSNQSAVFTPLTFAELGEHTKLVKLLLSHGAEGFEETVEVSSSDEEEEQKKEKPKPGPNSDVKVGSVIRDYESVRNKHAFLRREIAVK